jgi:hypothetical protein
LDVLELIYTSAKICPDRYLPVAFVIQPGNKRQIRALPAGYNRLQLQLTIQQRLLYGKKFLNKNFQVLKNGVSSSAENITIR